MLRLCGVDMVASFRWAGADAMALAELMDISDDNLMGTQLGEALAKKSNMRWRESVVADSL